LWSQGGRGRGKKKKKKTIPKEKIEPTWGKKKDAASEKFPFSVSSQKSSFGGVKREWDTGQGKRGG